jgi:hypothetical protein
MSTLRDLNDPRLRELPDSGPQLVIGKRAMRTGEELVEQRDHPARALAWRDQAARAAGMRDLAERAALEFPSG